MRIEKKTVVELIKEWIKASPYVIVVDYTGMTVPHLNEIRNRLEGAQAELHIVKNTYLSIALEQLKLPSLDEHLKGQTAIVYGKSDIAAAAKVIKNFVSEFEKPVIRVALLGDTLLPKSDVLAIADLPSREVILAKLLGLLNAPATKLATIINTPATQLAHVIKAHVEKGNG